MPSEALTLLAPHPGATILDVTAGGGGHLELIAQAVGTSGRVIGLDRDLRALAPDAAGRLIPLYPQVTLVHAPFSEARRVLDDLGVKAVDGLICDLGVSSPQLDAPSRGFSFLRDGPIDMRMDTSKGQSAYEAIQSLSESALADIIYQFGEEHRSRRIARAIKSAASLPNSTLALAALIEHTVPRMGRIHPATRTFQALRIYVNHELDEICALLNALPNLLNTGGRAVFISFHSLEDRLIKFAFRKAASWPDKKSAAFSLLTKKPQAPSRDEEIRNKRARSAKLRGLARLKDVPSDLGALCDG